MFAAWQAGAEYRAPSLEALGRTGRWTLIAEQFGYPAGMPRRMVLPLPRLPDGTRSLRLSTNQEIYWDRVAVAWAEPCSDARREVLVPVEASLEYVGFPARSTGVQRVPHYDYGRRAPLWDTRYQRGFYTDFGPATPLVEEADDALAIFAAGEEIHLAFPAAAAPPSEGWQRLYVLETVGWCKDMDLYTRDGDTVGPLPARGRDLDHRERLHARFNTRFESGR
jgi:hypothetical protein